MLKLHCKILQGRGAVTPIGALLRNVTSLTISDRLKTAGDRVTTLLNSW